MMNRPIRIGNCSGFYGDRFSAASEMVEGGPIDVLTGDYLAELTLLILWKAKEKDSRRGYALTFLDQMEEVLGRCLDRRIKIVVNAGGLNPSGLASDLGSLATKLGLSPKIGYVEGDDLSKTLQEMEGRGIDLRHLDTGQRLSDSTREPVSANAYLGGWGIAEALAGGADIVICPRVTDASLVVGPSAWWHGWQRDSFDSLAGAIVAGHIIECGPQATGGNYSWIGEITDRRLPGFPIAEIESSGDAIITKHPNTGGLVSKGTVTAQLLYEIAQPQYINPDAVAHFDTVQLEEIDRDRVKVFGTKGSPPPNTLKVAINCLAGYRNSMTLVITGLDIEQKATLAEDQLFEILGGKDSFDEVDVRLLRFDHREADQNELNTAHLRITVKASDPMVVGRRFSNATMQLALGGYAGFYTTTPPSSESAFSVFWPTLVPAEIVKHVAVLPDGSRVDIAPTSITSDGGDLTIGDPVGHRQDASVRRTWKTTRRPLGRICGARSGDKGGNANVGLWTRDQESFVWLSNFLTTDKFRSLVPEAASLPIHRYELPNLLALNFVVVGLLGEGVASSTRPDPQAKGFGEFVRSREVDIPDIFL